MASASPRRRYASIASSAVAASRKPIGVSLLLAEMGEQARRAREDRDAADERSAGTSRSAQRRRDRHRDVHRQRLAPGLGDRVGQRSAAATARPATPAFARERDHALGARIERLVQGMAVAGDRPPRLAIGARDRERGIVRARAPASTFASTSSSSPRQRSAAPRITVPQPSTPAATAPCSAAGIGRERHPRRLHRGRQPMLGDRDQAEIEKNALVLGRRASGGEQDRRTR